MEVLLVEDDRTYASLFSAVMSSVNPDAVLHIVTDGKEAKEFLNKEGRFINSPSPNIVFTDHYMPHGSGLTVTENVRSIPSLRFVPVVLMTGVNVKLLRHSLAKKASEAGCNSFVSKGTIGNLTKVVEYWINIAVW